MNILFKNILICDPKSSHHQTKKDILIMDGVIQDIGKEIIATVDKVIEIDNLNVSQGWFDLKASFGDPGYEHKETIESGLEAAAFGGFTHVANVPQSNPVCDNKASVEYQLRVSSDSATTLLPIGAVTKGLKGLELAEQYDMFNSGVRLFTDDTHPLNAGICYRSLLYGQNFGGKTMVFARNNSLASDGMVNDGIASVKTGIKADPSISETIDLEKTISIAKYTNSEVHITGISTINGVELIRQAKKDGLKITADVHVMNLVFNELKVLDFDTNFKVLPVLRTEEDRISLWKGLVDGTIDAIVSDHRPNDIEETVLEFDNANFGSIQLQTLFGALGNCKEFNLELVLEKLTNGPRYIYGIETNPIEIGTIADLTFFFTNNVWTFEEKDLLSKSKNSPFINKTLTGSAFGIYNNSKLALREQ